LRGTLPQIIYWGGGGTWLTLGSAFAPGKPSIEYANRGPLVYRVEKPDGRVITTEYNSAGKVAAQYAPVGPNGEMCPIGRYVYHTGATQVFDAEGNQTIYWFNDKNQILALETYQDNTLYRSDRFSWDGNGNLIQKSIEDGAATLVQSIEYKLTKITTF
jgi:hypothetical protein